MKVKYKMSINKVLKKYTNPKKPVIEVKTDIMPAYAHDYGNYVARYGMGNFQIQAVMRLDGRLDYDKLSRAVRLSVDSEPVLGCHFVEHDPPYWKRIEDIDNATFCSMEQAKDEMEAINRFLESPLDMDHDPMIKVKLIRSEQFDTLVIKLNHACSDGAGAKEYIDLLSHIYSCLCESDIYIPVPSVRNREDHIKVFDALGIKHPELDSSPIESPRTAWPFPWKFGEHKGVTPFVVCRLPYGQLDILSKYGKERGATINDLILTAFYRAMFKLTQPPYGIPMDIGLTIDLRRYIPGNKAGAIRNFSGGIVPRIARVMGEPFEGTLSRVAALMNRKKNDNPGYQCATGAERAERVNFHFFLAYSKFMSKISGIISKFSIFCSPGLSNVGIISKSPIRFGDKVVSDAYIIPPVILPPGLMLVASSYNGILTFAIGYYKGSINRRHLEKLLDKIKFELIEGCR